MKINVLKTKETLSIEEALDVKGGLNPTFGLVATGCTCDCIISNKNENEEKNKLAIVTKSANSFH